MRHLPLISTALLLTAMAVAQPTPADYKRGDELRKLYEPLVRPLPEPGTWVPKTHRYVYRHTTASGAEYLAYDADARTSAVAFDIKRLAESLSKAAGRPIDPNRLPFRTVRYLEDGHTIEYRIGWTELWRTDLNDYTTKRGGDDYDCCNPTENRPAPSASFNKAVKSPDGKWEAFTRDFNLYVRAVVTEKPADKDAADKPRPRRAADTAVRLSADGSEGNYYDADTLIWSPDSKRIATWRIRPGQRRRIPYIANAPEDQVQPRFFTIEYAKPGDTLDLQQPVLFDVVERRQTNVDNALFPNPYELHRPEWRADSRAFTFNYNQRGHQVFRVIEVDAATGRTRAVISEEAQTFFCYSGKMYRHDVADGKEVIWMSERDGWNHLYLYDGATGKVKNQITRGEWVVRGVDSVDETKRQIYFHASGMDAGKDPYFNHYFRVNFDGTGLTRLTTADGNHTVAFSSDYKFLVDTWSRLDAAPVAELHQLDTKATTVIEQADLAPLVKAGWRAPEVFTAKGRDGKTDIWGIIVRPTKFDATKKYPVIEYIYAGPQDSFVPKSFSTMSMLQPLAELGFIVVQIDGMGTSNRSKAFHDVAWKNLQDAGFPDRILWHKAVAARYAYYDISRVGIWGHSAGGQNALGALLFHPEFYTAAVASGGCHDNRMDKIWWNEQWMGWPLGPEYAAASNVDNAHKLKGHLLLMVGALDDNVDPASTIQVAQALIQAGKTFDFLMLPREKHTWGGDYGERKRRDFFVRHLQGVEPPNWNAIEEEPKSAN